MREIKFRAWDKEMIYGVGLDPDCIPYKIPEGVEDSENFEYYPDARLMQFTGLKDKNGKEIYEGDILNKHIVQSMGLVGEEDIVNDIKAEVVWRGIGFSFDYIDDWVQFSNDISSELEVIGNIYENPELLKEKQ